MKYHALILLCLFAAPACKKREAPKSKRAQHEEAAAKASFKQAAVMKFGNALREIFQWRQSQPTKTEAERKALLKEIAKRMKQVPAEGLPNDLQDAWQPMLSAWQVLADNPGSDAALRDAGAHAATKLNSELAAQGLMDIRF